MIKKVAVIVLVGLTLGGIGGCITKIQVIDDGSSSTNNI